MRSYLLSDTKVSTMSRGVECYRDERNSKLRKFMHADLSKAC